MSKDALFSEFLPVSKKEWKQKIQFDLKGADYNNTLVWESLEGINVTPFYHKEDIANQAKYKLPKDHKWAICERIYAGNSKKANSKAVSALEKGAQSIWFYKLSDTCNWSDLLTNINLDSTSIHLEFDSFSVELIDNLISYIKGKENAIYLHLDILGNLTATGNWKITKEEDHKRIAEILKKASAHFKSILAVNVSNYQNAGANTTQQLAYAMAHVNEYLNYFGTIEKSIVFKVAVGGNYFFEISKLRALRWLFSSLVDVYNLPLTCEILAFPTNRNKTIYDYNVNMLRTTSESMAAALGGANTVCNFRYDEIYNKDNEFGERIARNQLLLLKKESYFDEALFAAEGNYYIESLTHKLAEKALELLKQIEASGGFLKQLKEGVIQRKLKESAAKEQQLFNVGKLIAIGSNKYQNQQDRMKDNLELYPFLKIDKRQTAIEPILPKRLTEEIEQKRLKDE